jgi:hypothetical protein
MQITLISAGDPLPEWGAAQISKKTFGLSIDIEKKLFASFPDMKPLEFEPSVTANKLPMLKCNTCDIVALPYIKTLKEMFASTHIYSSLRITESNHVNGIYLLCRSCLAKLSIILEKSEAGEEVILPRSRHIFQT